MRMVRNLCLDQLRAHRLHEDKLEEVFNHRTEEGPGQQEDLKDMMRLVYVGLNDYEAGDFVMTDDKAPVELLGMRVIDSIIADEVAYYKKVYAEDGLKGPAGMDSGE